MLDPVARKTRFPTILKFMSRKKWSWNLTTKSD